LRVKAWKAAIGGTGTVIAVTVPARVGVSSEERVSCRCMSVVSMCVVAHLGGHVVGRRFMGGHLMGRHLMGKYLKGRHLMGRHLTGRHLMVRQGVGLM